MEICLCPHLHIVKSSFNFMIPCQTTEIVCSGFSGVICHDMLHGTDLKINTKIESSTTWVENYQDSSMKEY